MISATTWVPRGIASEFPEQYELDDDEMNRISSMANLQLEDAKEGLKEAASKLQDKEEFDDDLKEYDLEHYDDDTSDSNGVPVTMFPGLTNSGASYFKGDDNEEMDDEEDGEAGNGQDYLTLPNEKEQLEEKQELQVYPTDNLVLATRTEDDVSYLDVYVYDDGAGAPEGSKEEDADKQDPDVARGMIREGNLYVHHDLMLPNFPLCVEWLSVKPGVAIDDSNVANFAAVGTMDPTIELWNLDCVDKAFPDAILGESADSLGTSGKKNKSRDDCHVDAVLSLAHNPSFRNVLASASADTTVKLWDLSSLAVARSISKLHHGKNVASAQWHSGDGSILLTAGYDGQCAVSDVRIEKLAKMAKYYKAASGEEVESAAWATDLYFYAGTDQGNVYYFDARNQSEPVWTLHAHDSGITALSPNTWVDNMLVTGAMGDKQLKLWRTTPTPSMVFSRDFGCGNVLASTFAPDIEVGGDLVVGGSTPGLKLWDAFSNRYVRTAFKNELRQLQQQARDAAQANGRASRIARKYGDKTGEQVMGVENDEEAEEEDEEEE